MKKRCEVRMWKKEGQRTWDEKTEHGPVGRSMRYAGEAGDKVE